MADRWSRSYAVSGPRSCRRSATPGELAPVAFATVSDDYFRTLGIPPTLAYEVEKRPFYVTRDGKGKAIEALFA